MNRSRSLMLALALGSAIVVPSKLADVGLSTVLAQTPDASTSQASVPMDAQAVVRQTQPAVATVVNEQAVPADAGGTANQDQSQMPGLQPVGIGTGFLIDTNGNIVTNEHVVRGGESFQVILQNGETRPGRLVGSDPISDLAVIKISGSVPATLGFGDSSQVQVGEPVLAIGSSLGSFTGTVTDGIVGAVGRDFPAQLGAAGYSNLIQHDAPINHGNSGGPLVDARGQVIGVNTLGINEVPQAGPVQGLFFAIPSNTVQQIVTQLLSAGQVTYPYLGAQIEEITPDIAGQYNLPVDFGAMVADVSPDSPAAQAGIQQGDIITALGDQKLDAETSFSELLFAHKPGDQVTLTVQRPDGSHDVAVTLGTRPTGQ
ncbi:MAG: trypsin-like peptidase domain-containing protein [Thermomicrobiales bacterium]